MANRVRVILLEDISELGRVGDIVSVSEGYARNALFPAGRAALASDKEVSRLAKQREAIQRAADANLKQMQAQAEALDGTELTMSARAKNDEEIFGKISAAHIAKELEQQSHLKLRASDIYLVEPITTLGTHAATLSFGQGIEATIQVVVTAADHGH